MTYLDASNTDSDACYGLVPFLVVVSDDVDATRVGVVGRAFVSDGHADDARVTRAARVGQSYRQIVESAVLAATLEL